MMHRHIRRLKVTVTRLVAAEIENAWKGAGHPDDIPATEERLRVARKQYREAVESVSMEINNRIPKGTP
jgi:hypothetical protein